MSAYFVALLCAGVLVFVAHYTPQKKKKDWRHLTNEDRGAIYEMARFALLGAADLEHNLRREIEGRKAKEEFMKWIKDRH